MDALTVWAQGTAEALERQHGRPQVVTDRQINASLEVENAQLRAQLDYARERIRELEAQLAAIEQPHEELITYTEAASRMHVHISTISRWVAAGHCQTRSVGGRKKPFILAHTLHRPQRKKRRKS